MHKSAEFLLALYTFFVQWELGIYLESNDLGQGG